MSKLAETILASRQADVRRWLDEGHETDAIRVGVERKLTDRLANVAEDDPARQEILRAHADYQRAVEEAIREWESSQGGSKR